MWSHGRPHLVIELVTTVFVDQPLAKPVGILNILACVVLSSMNGILMTPGRGRLSKNSLCLRERIWYSQAVPSYIILSIDRYSSGPFHSSTEWPLLQRSAAGPVMHRNHAGLPLHRAYVMQGSWRNSSAPVSCRGIVFSRHNEGSVDYCRTSISQGYSRAI